MEDINDKNLESIYHQVHPEYYEMSYKKNILQRLWYNGRFGAMREVLYPLKDGAKILDVGCGSGFALEKSIPPGKNFDVYGIDVTQEIIDYAAAKRPSFHFRLAKGENLPFDDNQFDAVVFMDVIEHLIDPLQALKETKRVLKEGGSAIILVVEEEHPLFKRIWWAWTKLKGKVWEGAHLHVFDAKSLQKTVESVGLKIDKFHKFHLGMMMLLVAHKRGENL